jgi:hypothetical protein
VARGAANRIRYIRLESEERCQQRLKRDLAMNDEAVEVIMTLRGQVVALQRRLRELESQLEVYDTAHGARLRSYRQVSFEAVWEDVNEP